MQLLHKLSYTYFQPVHADSWTRMSVLATAIKVYCWLVFACHKVKCYSHFKTTNTYSYGLLLPFTALVWDLLGSILIVPFQWTSVWSVFVDQKCCEMYRPIFLSACFFSFFYRNVCIRACLWELYNFFNCAPANSFLSVCIYTLITTDTTLEAVKPDRSRNCWNWTCSTH